MAKNQLTRILTSPDKDVTRTSGANGVLARLFRKMLLDLNINPTRWGKLMADFITDRRNGVPDNKKDQTSMRGNLTKEFARPQMTWKVFCKALRFLQIRKIELAIKAHHDAGVTSIHSTAVDFGSRSNRPSAEQEEIIQMLDNGDAVLVPEAYAKAYHHGRKPTLHAAPADIEDVESNDVLDQLNVGNFNDFTDDEMQQLASVGESSDDDK